MVKVKVALAFAAVLFAGCVGAEQPVEATIKKTIEARLGAAAKVESVTATPSGLYEVRIGNEIIYTDKNADYMFIGDMYNAKTSQNLTRARKDELNKIKFSELPLGLALKTVKGDGKRVIAIFEDPNCGYCKRFRQTTLKQVDNVTVYTFMYNILSPDSFVKSTNVWCSVDRNRTWDEWMVDGKVPPTVSKKCDTPNDKVVELGQKLRIEGTPAIFFTDGTRIPGAVDLQTLEAKFASLKK
ncbi:MAG TPA: DsbC family protein [Telluria sp.]|nr:DsbC family protein [Telluria sp.]